jgi:hypothetical protein
VPFIKGISSCLAQAVRFGIAGLFVGRRKMLVEDVNRALAGYSDKAFGRQRMALESTLPPHNDDAARRVSAGIGSCFHAQSEFLLTVYNPKCMGISRHVEVQNLTPVVADDEKAEHQT